MIDKKGMFICGYEKLDEKGKSEVMKLMAWLNEKAEIEKRFKNKTSALLCRECCAKTGYTMRKYVMTHLQWDCELCRNAETAVFSCSSWEKAAHWEGGKKK